MFYVSTTGSSGSLWFARALNKHPQLVAFHGIQSLNPDNGAHLDEPLRLTTFLQSIHRCYQTCLAEKAFGCVHGWLSQTVRPAILAMGGVHMAMIRHPILRVNSLFFRELETFNPLNIDPADVFNALAGERWQYAEFNFQHNSVSLESYAQKFYEQCRSVVMADRWDLLNIPPHEMIEFEKVTSDRAYFETRFEFLAERCRQYARDNPRKTVPELACSPAYVESVFAMNPNNKKAKKHRPEDGMPDEVFALWPAAFRLLFASALKANGGLEMVRLYETFGYRLPASLQNLPYVHWAEKFWQALEISVD